MRLHLLRCLLLLQFYFLIAHEAFSLSHTFYLLLLYSCKSFKALSFNRSRDAHAQTSVEQSQQLTALNLTICTPPSPISVHPVASKAPPPSPPPNSVSVAPSAASATAALPQPARIHTLLPIAPQITALVKQALINSLPYKLQRCHHAYASKRPRL